MVNKQVFRNILRIVVFLFCIYCFYKAFEIYTISNVFNQRVNAYKNSLEIRNIRGIPHKKLVLQWYVNGLHNINTSYCPQKFQLAWFDYMHACELQAQQTPKVIMSEMIAWKLLGETSMADKPAEVSDELQRASYNLERVALEYGVHLIHR